MKRYSIILVFGLLIGVVIAYYGYFYLYKSTDYIKVEYTPPYMMNDPNINFKASYVSYENDSIAKNLEYERAKDIYGYMSRHLRRLKPEKLNRDGVRVYKEQALFLYSLMDMNVIILKIKHNQQFNPNECLQILQQSMQSKSPELWDNYLKRNKLDVHTIDVWHTFNGMPLS